MSSRPMGFGFSAELAAKKDLKYSVSLELDVRLWIEAVIKVRLSESSGPIGVDAMHVLLKDGTVLCRLMNVLKPGSIGKINESTMAFKQQENISNFLSACVEYGCKEQDLFKVTDLYHKENMPQVINGIKALAQQVQKHGWTGPVLVPSA